MNTHDHFPMYIDTKDKSVVVIGGGSIADRRIKTLSKFSFQITVLSEQITDEISSLCDGNRIRYVPGTFNLEKPESYIEIFAPAFMVLACTDDRDLNEQIGSFCKEHDIHVNVCDAQDESTFWFPAVALNDELVMGLVGDGNSHETVRNAAAALRKIIEERLY